MIATKNDGIHIPSRNIQLSVRDTTPHRMMAAIRGEVEEDVDFFDMMMLSISRFDSRGTHMGVLARN